MGFTIIGASSGAPTPPPSTSEVFGTFGLTDSISALSVGPSNGKGASSSIGTLTEEIDGFYLFFLRTDLRHCAFDLGVGIDDASMAADLRVTDLQIPSGSASGLKIPVRLSAGDTPRIRYATNNNAGAAYAKLVPYQNGGLGFSAVKPLPGQNNLPAVAGSTAAIGSTSWTAIGTPLLEEAKGIFVAVEQGSDTGRTAGQFALEIGIGAAGSETPIGPALFFQSSTGSINWPGAVGPLQHDFPSGTQFSFRLPVALADAVNCAINYVKP